MMDDKSRRMRALMDAIPMGKPVAYFLRQDSAPPMWDQVADRYKDDADVCALYTAEQLQAAVAAETERCAKLCEENSFRETNEGVVLAKHRGPLNHDGQRYGAAIRATKER